MSNARKRAARHSARTNGAAPPAGAQAEPQASLPLAPTPTPPVQPFALIATPSHDGKLFENYTLSLINLVAEARDLHLQIFIMSGESLITRARNNIVAMFMDNPAFTHLFFIDSDIGFTSDAVRRLLNSGHDISAGVYPLKHEGWPDEGLPQHMTQAEYEVAYTRYTVNTGRLYQGDGAEIQIDIDPNGFITLDEAPTGFMCISRNVIERLIEAYPDYRYTPDHIGGVDTGHHYRFFDCAIDPISRRYLSEDYAFCRLWSALGGKVHVDARSNLTHRGHKTFRGPFAASLATSLAHAVGAPAGAPMRLTGLQHLHPAEAASQFAPEADPELHPQLHPAPVPEPEPDLDQGSQADATPAGVRQDA